MAEIRWGTGSAMLTPITWVGTDPACGVRIRGGDIAPRHGLLFEAPSGWFFQDLKTGGKSVLNGRRVDLPARLLDGDELVLGRTKLRFVAQEDDTDPSPRTASIASCEEGQAKVHAVATRIRSLMGSARKPIVALLDQLSELLGGARVELFFHPTLRLFSGPPFVNGRPPDGTVPPLPAPPPQALAEAIPTLFTARTSPGEGRGFSLLLAPFGHAGARCLLRASSWRAFDSRSLQLLVFAATGLHVRLRPLFPPAKEPNKELDGADFQWAE